MIIPLPELFSWSAMLGYLARSSDETLYRISDGAVSKLFYEHGEMALVRFEYVSGQTTAFLSSAHHLEASFLAPNGEAPSPRMKALVRRYAEEWFDLDRDLTDFYALAQRDPLLRGAAEEFHGLRIVGIPDLFEAICWGIIGQQINLSFAYTLKKRFTEAFGRQMERDGELFWAFPKPEDVAKLQVQDIAVLQMTARKSEYLIGAAKALVDGSIDKASLLTGGWAQAERRLLAMRGIGPWTAHYVLMRCLRMPEALPAADVGLHHAIRVTAAMDRKPTEAEVRELAKAWAGWEAYATFYLWRTLY
ncbi:DNA-3-methyladenine glycosylase II [Paenibacillaceae bacterium GAS479]|nr:DNA-3-methyladenine glycosylase II [Paenibacillaceae bacterium GAS479]